MVIIGKLEMTSGFKKKIFCKLFYESNYNHFRKRIFKPIPDHKFNQNIEQCKIPLYISSQMTHYSNSKFNKSTAKTRKEL